MDALSSAVAMKVYCDVLLTIMASSFHRLLGARVGNGFKTAKSNHIFRDLVNATADLSITENEIAVHFHEREHNPQLVTAEFSKSDMCVPWLEDKRLRLKFA